MTDQQHVRSQLPTAAILIMAGLLVEAFCLLWSRPLAFVVLVGLGGLLILAGVAVFLFSLVSAPSQVGD